MRKLTPLFTWFVLVGLSLFLSYLTQPSLWASEKSVTANQSESIAVLGALMTNSRCRDSGTTIATLSEPVSDWLGYTDPDYRFKLEYPAKWKLETTIQQSEPFDSPKAIVKRLSAWGDGGAIDLDVWLANGYGLEEWLQQYSTLTGTELPSSKANATIAGQSAVVFLERQTTVDMLTAFLNDGKYIYRFWYTITQNPQGVEAYWHMLESFSTFTGSSASTEIPSEVKRSVDDAIQISGVRAGSYCCNRYSPYCSNHFGCCSDQGNCTWWVCYSFGAVPFRGDAESWWRQVPTYPDWTRSTLAPRTNQWNIAYWNTGTSGHVAFISSYTGGGSVNITEMSYCKSCYNARAVSIDDPYGFIYEKNPPLAGKVWGE